MITITGFADEISEDLDIQLDVLESEGISHLEFRAAWGKNVLKLSDDEILKVKEKLDARGFKVSAIGSPIGKIKITDDFAPHFEDFQHAITLAKYFNTPYIRIFSFFIPEGQEPAQYRTEVMNRMKRLTMHAEKEGIVLLHENEKHIYGDTEQRCLDIFHTCNSLHLRCAFDPANYIQCKVLPMTDAYSLIEPFIAYIHVKDALIDSGKVVPAGEGDGEIRRLIATLKENNFTGFMSLEPHLAADGKFEGFTGAERFVVATQALKKLLQEEGLDWQ